MSRVATAIRPAMTPTTAGLPTVLLFLLALLTAGSCSADASDAPTAKVVHETSSPFYRKIFVVDEGELRSLRFRSPGDDSQSLIRIGHPEQLPMPYLRSAAVGLTVPQSLERLLMVGLGGGAFANFVRVALPGVHVDAVEIDPVVAELARDYFALAQGDKLRVHVEDAVVFVSDANEAGAAPYDYILLDAYDADEIPEALLGSSFLTDVRRRLATDGVVVANVAISGTRKTRQVIRKLAGHFHYCVHLRSPPRYNDVLLLSLQPLPAREDLAAQAELFEQTAGTEIGLRSYADTAEPCFGAQ